MPGNVANISSVQVSILCMQSIDNNSSRIISTMNVSVTFTGVDHHEETKFNMEGTLQSVRLTRPLTSWCFPMNSAGVSSAHLSTSGPPSSLTSKALFLACKAHVVLFIFVTVTLVVPLGPSVRCLLLLIARVSLSIEAAGTTRVVKALQHLLLPRAHLSLDIKGSFDLIRDETSSFQSTRHH